MLRTIVPLILALGLFAAGCAREAPSARVPDPSFSPWITRPGYAWPPRTLLKEDRMKPGERALSLSKTDPITTANRPPLPSDSLIPGGEDCVDRLRERGVHFDKLPAERGVDTPILVRGPLGGVQFWSHGGPMVVDCRMALALDRVGPEFVALGVTRARFSGAYVYRTSKKGRLSLHAYGLAIDMHDVSTEAGVASVKGDYQRGLADGCSEEAPLLNRLACRLRRQGLFRELLTPDYDADHQDHLHLGLAPLPHRTSDEPGSEPSSGHGEELSSSSASETKVAPHDAAGKARPQVKPAGKRVDPGSAHVKRPPSGMRVASLRPNLKNVPDVPRHALEAESSDEAR